MTLVSLTANTKEFFAYIGNLIILPAQQLGELRFYVGLGASSVGSCAIAPLSTGCSVRIRPREPGHSADASSLAAFTFGLFSHTEREPVNPDKPHLHREVSIPPRYSGGAGPSGPVVMPD